MYKNSNQKTPVISEVATQTSLNQISLNQASIGIAIIQLKYANNLFHLSLSVMVMATPCSIVKRSLFYAPQKHLHPYPFLSTFPVLSFIFFLLGRVPIDLDPYKCD
jgi:hypothetical protein